VGHGQALAALADPTRRKTFELLTGGAFAVGQIADRMPVSRPAISQHLRVLKEAGLVTERRDGTRRLYSVAPEGMDEIRAYIDRMWSEALASYEGLAKQLTEERLVQEREVTGVKSEHDVIEPVVKTVRVDLTQQQAFELFTEGMGRWWPLQTHSIAVDTHEGRVRAESLIFEPREGGRIYEVMSDGQEGDWGTVLEWNPPSRVVFSWKPNLSDGPWTEVEVRFAASGNGTKVELVHRGWERFGIAGSGRRQAYEEGWVGLLELYREAARQSS
jgi:DNA-binding transcriptional ArsR family regulator/uncharacterized protein YndB with AHSA1/START domain